mgnify:CR=1 FL=1
MPVKSGYRTSEWIVTIAGLLINAGMFLGVLNEDEAAKIRNFEIGAIVTTIGTVGYSVARSWVKVNHPGDAKALEGLEAARDKALAGMDEIVRTVDMFRAKLREIAEHEPRTPGDGK